MPLPPIGQLILPNLSWWSLLGVLLIALGVILLLNKSFRLLTKVYDKAIFVPWISIALGVIFLWAFSIIQDLWNSNEGKAIVIGFFAIAATLVWSFLKRRKESK